MQEIESAIALFKDANDAQLWEAYLDGISTLWSFTVGDDLERTLERACAMKVRPGVVILSGSLYRGEGRLVSQLRDSFPGAQIVLISSCDDPAPPMLPLVQDQVRHLAITPPDGDCGARGYFEAVLQQLVAREAWRIEASLAPGTPLESFTLGSSEGKEGVICSLEEVLAGDSPAYDMLRQRSALLADELLENALYNAPQCAQGRKLFRKGAPRAVSPGEELVFRFGFDGDTLAMEMTDNWGTLRPEQVMEYLSRNVDEIPDAEQAGGRGLFIIWRFFDHFHVSITPGARTVISGDLRLSREPDPEAPRGFHISTHDKEED